MNPSKADVANFLRPQDFGIGDLLDVRNPASAAFIEVGVPLRCLARATLDDDDRHFLATPMRDSLFVLTPSAGDDRRPEEGSNWRMDLTGADDGTVKRKLKEAFADCTPGRLLPPWIDIVRRRSGRRVERHSVFLLTPEQHAILFAWDSELGAYTARALCISYRCNRAPLAKDMGLCTHSHTNRDVLTYETDSGISEWDYCLSIRLADYVPVAAFYPVPRVNLEPSAASSSAAKEATGRKRRLDAEAQEKTDGALLFSPGLARVLRATAKSRRGRVLRTFLAAWAESLDAVPEEWIDDNVHGAFSELEGEDFDALLEAALAISSAESPSKRSKQ